VNSEVHTAAATVPGFLQRDGMYSLTGDALEAFFISLEAGAV